MLEQRIQQQFFESADLKYQSAETLARPVAEAAQAQGFVPEWPRKTAKGKEAPPLSSS